MTHSNERSGSIEGRSEAEVEVESGGRRLSGRLFYPEQPRERNPAIVFLQGWRSIKDRNFEVAHRLAANSIFCLAIDLSGHGQTEGDPATFSRKDFQDDATAAYDFLAGQNGVDPEHISVVGTSFGGYLAVLLSRERRVHSLVLRAPADYPDKGFTEPRLQRSDESDLREWRKSVRDSQSSESLRRIRDFTGSILVVESGSDDVVPRETVQSYINAAPNPDEVAHIILENAPHSLSQHPDLKRKYDDILVDWFRDKK